MQRLHAALVELAARDFEVAASGSACVDDKHANEVSNCARNSANARSTTAALPLLLAGALVEVGVCSRSVLQRHNAHIDRACGLDLLEQNGLHQLPMILDDGALSRSMRIIDPLDQISCAYI